MMKKLFVLMSLTLVAGTAQATDYLQYRSSNGSVSPMFSISKTCTISGNSVRIQERVGDIMTSKILEIQWGGIRNEAVLSNLVFEIHYRGYVSPATRPTPVGAITETYATLNNGKQDKILVEKIGGITGRSNTSPLADRLYGFIRMNCASIIK